jgi:isocitrate/isopropylmalate dehydrogenase
VTKRGVLTPDLGGKATTAEVTRAVISEVADITVKLAR